MAILQLPELGGSIPLLARDETVALWALLEVDAPPAEQLGNVEDLAGDPNSTPALAIAPIVSASLGRGREFGADLGLVGVERVADSTRLTRSCSIRAVLRYAIGEAGDTDVGTICARGLSGSDAERILFGAEIERDSAQLATLRARWQELDGTEAIAAGVSFPPPDGEFHVAIVRRWRSTTEVLVDYVINGELVGTETITEGDIGEGEGGSITIGCAGDGAGDYERFLPETSVIDMLGIEADAITIEELRAEYRRLAIHQPAGGALVRQYLPPGTAYTRNPESRLQRLISALGDSLGLGLANAQRLLEDFPPDRAYGAALVAWERMLRLSPLPSDEVAERRARVLAHFRLQLGYPRADIKIALEPLFQLNAADIAILEYSALRIDPFDVDDIGTPPSRIWRTYQGVGGVAIAGGVCNVTATSGDNIRPNLGAPPHREASLSAATNADVDGAAFVTEITQSGRLTLHGHVWRAAGGSTRLIVGVRQYQAPTNLRRIEAVIVNPDGTSTSPHPTDPLTDVGGGDVIGGTLALSPNVETADWILLTRYVGAGVYEVAWSTTGLGGLTDPVQITGPVGPRWVGFGCFGVGGELATDVDTAFDNATIHEPSGTRTFCWQAHRDPGLGGTYDLDAAQLMISRQKPAHTAACAVDSLDGFTLAPTGSGNLGCDPLYPFDPEIS